MLVFAQARLVILSVPKTGTTALETALGPSADIWVQNPPDLKHAPVYRYNRFFRPMLERFVDAEMDVMAVMREPVSWLGSWWRYRQRPGMEGHSKATHDIPFDDFVAACCQGQRPAFADVGSQAKFLEPQKNGTRVTHLFRYEDPAPMMRFLSDRLERDVTTQRENVSPEMPMALSPATEARFRRKHAEEFVLYDSIA